MSSSCSDGCSANAPPPDRRYRRVLWIALAVNALMFLVELIAGWHAGSVSLLADAVDFLGDAANYAVSLAALGMGAVWRSRTALMKGWSMAGYGVFVLGKAAWAALHGVVPEPFTMGAVGVLALLANGGVAFLLYAFRQGDANMRSVWLCTRNDAIGNVAVLLAAGAVSLTGSGWPDLLVAVGMAALALSAAYAVVTRAKAELRGHAAVAVGAQRP
jgi:Co/Zn/Cd efflux system component